MRFRPQNHGFLFKQIMKHRVIKEPVANLPAFLADKDIVDPRPKRPSFPKWSPSVATQTQVSPPVADYRDTPVYEYRDHGAVVGGTVGEGEKASRLHDGLRQAQVLTNCVVYAGLPSRVMRRAKDVDIADQDQLVQEAIMQSHVWDSTSVKLPRRFNKDLPGWRMKAEVGIPQQKIISSMYTKLIRICESSMAAKDFTILTDRALTRDNTLVTKFSFQDKTVQIRSCVDLLATSREAVTPHCDDLATLKATSDAQLPDLYPVSPLINLTRQHFYSDTDTSCFKPGYDISRSHTLFISVSNEYSDDERNAEALMLCHGHAVNQARAQYGEDVSGVLASPVSVQCVVSDGHRFHFLCYQLNNVTCSAAPTLPQGGATTAATVAADLRNQAWLDSDNNLFRKLVPKRSMLRNTEYLDYDAEVFRKFAALFYNGLQM